MIKDLVALSCPHNTYALAITSLITAARGHSVLATININRRAISVMADPRTFYALSSYQAHFYTCGEGDGDLWLI